MDFNLKIFKSGLGPNSLTKMRIGIMTLIILMTSFQGFAGSNSQKISLKGDNISLKEIFKQISKQTGYDFIYTDDVIEKSSKITIDLTDVSLEEALEVCFKNQPLTYSIVEKMIVIKLKKPAELQELSLIKVTGTVSDVEGKPLPGATVLIKGTTKGTTTDANGNYTVKVPEGSVLVFSFVGFHKQEITVSAEDTEINVVMEQRAAELEEVAVISTGYQKIKPEQSTGSVATMRVKEYDSRINTTGFLTSLENRIPGLLINNDVEFEGNSLFQIRGVSTINGNRDPLIVIDGYPTELSLDMINPNEIESVTVLKDAAAATIYGARSSNGVIVIERKKAKAGKLLVNFRATAGFTPKENYDRYRWDKDASNTYLNAYRTRNESKIPSYVWTYITHPVFGAYYPKPAPYLIMAQQAAGIITEEEAEQQFQELGSYNNTDDYAHLFLRTASTQTYNLDISGGDKKLLYYLTANYTASDLSEIKNDESRFMLSGRATMRFSDRFSLELTTDFMKSKTNSVPIPDINTIYPYERFNDENGNPLPLFYGSYANPYYNEHIMSLGLLDNLYYPLVDINEISTKSYTIDNRITANFNYDIGNGFDLNFGGVYETSRTDVKYLAGENSSVAHQYVNYYTENGDDGLFLNIPKGSFLNQQTANTESYTLRAQLNYDKQINEDHSFNVILGGEMRDVLEKSNTASYFGYSDQTLLQQPIDYYTLLNNYGAAYAGVNPRLSYSDLFNQGYEDNRYVSIYSNVVYAYKGKYSFTGSIRIDQSNLFGTDPKYHYKPLWSIGAAWNIHKENFVKDVAFLNSLKLRAAYGFNGNVSKESLPQVIAEADYNYFNPESIIPMLTLLSYANNELRWEQTRNFNIGLDYDIFKNIKGSIDYYNKKSTDILAYNQIDASKGGTSAIINQASIRNSGLEISLHADWITRKTFNWNTGLVFSYNNSKVLEVYNDQPAVESAIDGSYAGYTEGYTVGAIFNYRYAGLDSSGNILVYDENGEPKELSDNTTKSYIDYSGSSIPAFNAGLSNRVDMGNFYIYCMINFYAGFKVRTIVPDAEEVRPLEGANNYWRQPGDETDPDVLPSLLYPSSTHLGYTDKYIVNGAYFTLSDLTASYSLRDNKLIKKVGISNFEIRLQASNLYTVAFNKYNYSIATGSYAKSYLTPTYTIGLYVNF